MRKKFYVTSASAISPQQTADAPATPAKTPAPRKRARLIVAIVVVVIVVAGIGGYLLHRHAQQVAYNTAHSLHAIAFTVSAPNYDSSTYSAIPLHVSGPDLDGNTVDTEKWIDLDGRGLELIQGTYTVVLKMSPFMTDDSLYATLTDNCGFTPGSDIADDAEYTVPARQTLPFSMLGPLSITNAQIDTAYGAAIASGTDSATADKLKDATVRTRQATIDQKTADDVAAAKAAELASRISANEAFKLLENRYFKDAQLRHLGNHSASSDDADSCYTFGLYDIDGKTVHSRIAASPTMENTFTNEPIRFRSW